MEDKNYRERPKTIIRKLYRVINAIRSVLLSILILSRFSDKR